MLSPSQIFCPSQLVLSCPPPQGQRSHAVERESERGEPAAARQRIYASSREAKEARRISQGQRPLRYLSSVRGRKLNCERGEIVENQAEPGKKQMKHIPRLHSLCHDFAFGRPEFWIMIQQTWMVTFQHWVAQSMQYSTSIGRMAQMPTMTHTCADWLDT